MADQGLSGAPPPLQSSSSHQNGAIRGATPKRSPPPHSNGTLDAGRASSPGPQPQSFPSSRTSASPLRTLRTLGGLMSPTPGPEGSSQRPRGQSLGSALSSRTRTMTFRTSKHRSSQQEEPDALLDLILEVQGQRLDDQRASLSLLPDPGPAALCGACSSDQNPPPTLDFYYMLIHYQSDRMEDQRCSLPDLEDIVGLVPEGQEDFFSLVQRVQSRRMDEQRALLQSQTADSSHQHLNHQNQNLY